MIQPAKIQRARTASAAFPSGWRRLLRDWAIGFALCMVVTGLQPSGDQAFGQTIGADIIAAGASTQDLAREVAAQLPLAAVHAPLGFGGMSAAALPDAGPGATAFLLALVLSGLAALNLAFWRHVVRAYAVPSTRRRP